jgi:type VII secretion protein EccE
MGYPWHLARDRWVLGIAIVAVITLSAWWRGLPLTTILRRRVALLLPNGRARLTAGFGTDVRAAAVLRITPPEEDPGMLPLPLIARYVDRYGLHADAIRVTSRDTTSDDGGRERQTWIGLTLSAADNLAALRARSPRIPLHQTAEVAMRRLADHLRESGCTASIVGLDEIPRLYGRSVRESWSSIALGSADYVAAYGVKVDTALPNTLAAIWSYPVREVWTALEIAGSGDSRTLAVACALRTDGRPGPRGPLPGLTSQSGNQRAALTALNPLSTQRLDGHSRVPEALLLTRLRWHSVIIQPRPRHAAVQGNMAPFVSANVRRRAGE